MNEIKNFLGYGKLKAFPSKRKLKIYALFFLAGKFEIGVEYKESEVNQILDRYHTFDNKSLLRRELYDNHFLDRKKDGSLYWLEPSQPILKEIPGKIK